MPVADNEVWQEALALLCQLQVVLPIPKFTVRDLLRLDRESVVDSRWQQTSDLPVRVNNKLIGWAEFEVSGEKVAIRFTELV
ncbi:MAG: FliM/FliN family flagellar motor switch protein [Acidobacteria bacterium]|nr:FliM/FliN family flagellar motor switch protein [Acidobacteriota bacterium]